MNKRHGTILVLTISAGLIAVGIITHQPASVLEKAVKICLECVGIG